MTATGRFIVRHGEDATLVEVRPDGRVRVGESADELTVTAISRDEYVVVQGDRAWRVVVAGPPDARWVGCEGAAAAVDVQPESQARAVRRAAPGALAAPMPGTVISVDVAVGQAVRAGELLLTLEAMKMELPIRAPRDGVVSAIRCAPGELVQPGPPLVDLS
jgi:biotin carboxyl carrier protein